MRTWCEEIVRQAVPADEQIAALLERFQREFYELGVRGIVETLEHDGVLAADSRRRPTSAGR